MSDFINDETNESYSISDFFIFIFGIIIGSIIGYYIFKKIKYIGPDSNEIVKQIYTDDNGRKYKYKPKITICPINYSMNKLHNLNFKEHH
jgi:hypothetical protein